MMDRRRKINAINSRLKRERKRAKLMRLESECEEMKAANSILKAENSRLEMLWQQANAVLLAGPK